MAWDSRQCDSMPTSLAPRNIIKYSAQVHGSQGHAWSSYSGSKVDEFLLQVSTLTYLQYASGSWSPPRHLNGKVFPSNVALAFIIILSWSSPTFEFLLYTFSLFLVDTQSHWQWHETAHWILWVLCECLKLHQFEFCIASTLRNKLGTWNCMSSKCDDIYNSLIAWLKSGPDI